MNRQTEGLKDNLKLMLPKYNIFQSKILKEEITLEIKMQDIIHDVSVNKEQLVTKLFILNVYFEVKES
jgi:hypothetical protein